MFRVVLRRNLVITELADDQYQQDPEHAFLNPMTTRGSIPQPHTCERADRYEPEPESPPRQTRWEE
jgi:hypothetical protein